MTEQVGVSFALKDALTENKATNEAYLLRDWACEQIGVFSRTFLVGRAALIPEMNLIGLL